jgi:hypothetical protein
MDWSDRMSEITKWPWKWTVNYLCPGDLKGARVYADTDMGQIVIAEVLSRAWGSQGTCNEAARIISKAPEMVELLERLANSFDGNANAGLIAEARALLSSLKGDS